MITKIIDYHSVVREAIKEYEDKYGEEPTCILIHPSVYHVFRSKSNIHKLENEINMDLRILTSADLKVNEIKVV